MSIQAMMLCDDRYPYSVRIDGELVPIGVDDECNFIYEKGDIE